MNTFIPTLDHFSFSQMKNKRLLLVHIGVKDAIVRRQTTSVFDKNLGEELLQWTSNKSKTTTHLLSRFCNTPSSFFYFIHFCTSFSSGFSWGSFSPLTETKAKFTSNSPKINHWCLYLFGNYFNFIIFLFFLFIFSFFTFLRCRFFVLAAELYLEHKLTNTLERKMSQGSCYLVPLPPSIAYATTLAGRCVLSIRIPKVSQCSKANENDKIQ